MPDVVLVSMPFGPVFSPSIGLSLLKATLATQPVSSGVRYFSIPFAERIGQTLYSRISGETKPSSRELPGEWIFSGALFERTAADEERYVEEILRRREAWTTKAWAYPISPAFIEGIRRARRHVDDFLDRCLDEIVGDRPRLVGFTSVFQQHVASLALARRVKQRLPDTFIVLGGSNCEGVMGAETIRQFSFVDAVVSGEGEIVFPELVRRVVSGEAVNDLQGVRSRDRLDEEFRRGQFPNAPSVRALDSLPYPDYTDFFDEFRASRYNRGWQPGLFFETSRGCWWGEKMHCTFCGLNGATMTYRSKSAGRAVDELVALTERHPGCDIQVVDNILDMEYFKTFLPALAERRLDFGLFYETKSNLKKEQVRMLRAAGVSEIQPGIESFSNAVLKLMRKGVSGLQNIQLLKWCKELGVTPCWNFLWGFPGEPAEEYSRMAKLAPLLTHLPPPVGFFGIRLDRFSPNFFDAERLGFADVRPIESYRHIYPLSSEAIANLAYHFAFQYREPRDVEAYVAPLLKELRAWKRVSEHSDLFAVDLDDLLLVWDLRPVSRNPVTALSGIDRLLYKACDAAADVRQLAETAERRGGMSAGHVEERLEALRARGLVVRDGSKFLALAVPLGEYTPPPTVVEKFYSVARSIGRPEGTGLVLRLDCRREHVTRRSTVQLRKRRRQGRRSLRALVPSRFYINTDGDLVIR